MLIAFLGFGLIGGSIARAVRATGPSATRLIAWTPSGLGPAQGLAEGVLDAVATSPAEAIADADLIVLAAPPLACLDLLDGLGGPWRSSLAPGATITDVASTKGAIVARAGSHRLPFVGGHPMAGLETSGFAAATAALFVDRPWVIVPGELAAERGVTVVEDLARACRARPIRMDASRHDAAVAGTSHLPLILAASLVEAVAGSVGRAGARGTAAQDAPFEPTLTAGGWRDMTRLARGDVAMGAGIAATNGPALAARIRQVRAILDGWLVDLEGPEGPDVAAVAERLRAARDRLEQLD